MHIVPPNQLGPVNRPIGEKSTLRFELQRVAVIKIGKSLRAGRAAANRRPPHSKVRFAEQATASAAKPLPCTAGRCRPPFPSKNRSDGW